jgi:hypothetical protein
VLCLGEKDALEAMRQTLAQGSCLRQASAPGLSTVAVAGGSHGLVGMRYAGATYPV